MRYVLKEMTIGEVLDVGVNIAKDNFKPLFMITLFLLVPVNLLFQFAMLGVVPDPPGMFASMQEQQAYQQLLLKNLSSIGVIFGIFMLASVVVTPITYAGMIRSIAGSYLGQPLTPGQAMRAGLSVALPYAVIHILTFAITVMGCIALIVPGIYLAIRLFLAPYCLIVEGCSISTAFSRSWELMKGNMMNGFVLGFIVSMAAMMTNGMAGMIPERHIAGILGALIGAATVIGSCATAVVFYFSCRCKHENFDLTILASGVGQEAPAIDTTDVGGSGGPGGIGGPSAPAQG